VIAELLLKIDESDLLGSLGYDKVEQLKQLLVSKGSGERSLSKGHLVRLIESYFGYDIFLERRLRHLIYNTLPPSELAELCSRYGKRVHSKSYDNALELAILPWKSGSEFVLEISKALNLPDYYLPVDREVKSASFEVGVPKPLKPLHEFQNDLKSQIISLLIKGRSRFLVQMPTGSGKTRTVLQSAIEFESKMELIRGGGYFLWIAHTEELCEQAIETFSVVWQAIATHQTVVHRMYGAYELSLTESAGGLLVGTFQKLTSLLASDSIILRHIESKLKLIIVDEAHKSTATTYAHLIENLFNKSDASLVGITATPGRHGDKESENLELAKFYDKTLLAPAFEGNPIVRLREKGILSKLKRVVIETNCVIPLHEKDEGNNQVEQDLSQSTLKNLASNSTRNEQILEVLEKQVALGLDCLVFACSVAHSRLLAAALAYKGINALSLDSSIARTRRNATIQSFKEGPCNVLVNFGILTTGFDAPNIGAVVITRPTSSVVLYSQMIGRGLRGPVMGGSKNCTLIDIKDNFANFGGIEKVYSYFEGYWAI
jgi:DNA repair protein RadD